MLVPLNLTGGDFQHESRPESHQVTRNFWPQALTNPKAKSPYILKSFYGMKLWKAQAGTRCRGTLQNQGVLYRVLDTTLYSVSSNGTHTVLGTIPGSNRCVIKACGAQVVVVNGSGAVYTWDGSTLTQNTSVNLGSPRAVTVINSQAIYDDGAGQGFVMADVGTPNTINGLNNAEAESLSDGLNFPYVYRDTVYFFGDECIEPWWNSGIGNPPIDKIQGGQILVGSDAVYSAAETPDYLFFFGSDRQVHSLTGGASAVDTVVSNEAMNKLFQDYAIVTDCIGWTMQLQGVWFYVLTFPIQDITWVLPVGGEWFQWGSGTAGRIRANSAAKVYGKTLVTVTGSGNIYELDANTYTDIDQTIIRTRRSAPIHGGLFKMDGKAFEINDLEILMEVGVGLVAGQGSDPMLAISFSRDGGKTFGTEQFLKCGTLGDTKKKLHTGPLGRFESDCCVQLRWSEPAACTIYSAAAEVEICI